MLGDITNLKDSLKQYTDDAVGSVDLSDYATKDELPVVYSQETTNKYV
jgi:hypothetical protein